jgi:heptosyltransferase-2
MTRPLCRGNSVQVKEMKLRRASKTMHPYDARTTGGSRAFEAMARAKLLRMTPLKWRLVRTFETLMRLLKPLTPPLRPFQNPKEPPASILVIEYWNLGDLSILVPFLRNLRQSFPRAKISLLVNSNLTHVLDGQGLVDAFIPAHVPWARHFNRWRKYNPFSSGWISLARTILQLRKQRFDWAFSGRMDVRDNSILWLSGARRRIGYGLSGGSSFLTDAVTPDLSQQHRADLWLGLLEALGVQPDRSFGGFRLTDDEIASARSFLSERGVPPGSLLIGIHPDARLASRRWGNENFAEVARRIVQDTEMHVLWFSEPGRPVQAPRLDHCHTISLSFRPFLAMLSCCDLLVCNDSGPMHLANLSDVPVVAVFGPTNAAWFGPRGPRDRVVIRPEFSCRPCFDYCIFDQPYCLRMISTDEVYSAVKDALQRLAQESATRAQSANPSRIPMGTAP